MMSMNVKVAYVNPVKPGKKNGSIKTEDNQIFGVPPHFLGQFRVGGSYQIEYDTHTWQGQDYKTVGKVVQLAAPESNTVRGNPRPIDDRTAERIFVCGLLNAAAGNGQLQIGDLGALQSAIAIARAAWANWHLDTEQSAPPKKPPWNEEMGDMVPF